MYKYLVVLAMMLAVAFAAPQYFIGSGIGLHNEAAKQVGLPYANGWTDGPNNGVGPVVHAYSPVAYHAGVAPFGYHAGVAGVQYVL